MYEELKDQAKAAAREICETAGLKKGQILVVGCSSSEICGERIGKGSNLEAAEAVFEGIYEEVKGRPRYIISKQI